MSFVKRGVTSTDCDTNFTSETAKPFELQKREDLSVSSEKNADSEVKKQSKNVTLELPNEALKRENHCDKRTSFNWVNSDTCESKISFGRRSQNFNPHNKKPYSNRRNYNREEKQSKSARKKAEVTEFRYGNYHQYYGYRNQGQIDSRILCMKQEWFKGKDVLDVGCNAGHFTLAIARDFSPNYIIGVDIDSALVKMAMRNVRHYIAPENICDKDFPISLALSYGPVAQAAEPRGMYPSGNFPFNVQFVQANYIFPFDELIDVQEPCFDTVLCLSLTKWIHLNWGDAGIKRLFKRIYAHLHPGGNLLLEAQAFNSYARKKKITEEVFQHYKEIQLFPEMFNEYLLKEVGFTSCELIDTPAHSSQGFSRPIYLFIKGKNVQMDVDKKPKHIVYHYSSDSHCEDSDVEQLSD